MVSALALVLCTGKSAAFSVLFSALLTAAMHGVNLMLVCMLPAFFQKYGKVSTVSGVLNSCTYVGSALSTYGIAVISETYNWSVTLVIWALIAALGTVICFAASRKQL
jgi:OPA family glycerol-3-phosphate transporter-like MFS transporter